MIINLLEDDNAFLAVSMDEKLCRTVKFLGLAKALFLVEVRHINAKFDNDQFNFEGRNFVMVYVGQDDIASVFLTSTWYNVDIGNVDRTNDVVYDIGKPHLYGEYLTFYKPMVVSNDY